MAYHLEGRLLEVCNCRVLCPCWIGEDPDNGTCGEEDGPFLESGGMVVMEAEHFHTKTARSSHDWTLTSDGASSPKCLRTSKATPSSATRAISADSWTSARCPPQPRWQDIGYNSVGLVASSSWLVASDL